jgi:ATP-dependent Clp protease ATP-binding subunit ClpX
VEKVLLKFEKRLPSTEIRKFVVTREVVRNPGQELKRLLEDPSDPDMLEAFEQLLQRDIKGVEDSIRDRREEFERRYGLSLWEGRIRLIGHRVVEKGYDVNTVFEEVADVNRQIEELEREFDRKHHILLTFNEEAIDQTTLVAFEEDEKGASVCARLSKDLEHGLRLIRDKTGKTEFTISKEAIKDPEGFLNVLIRDVYSKQSDPSTEGSL